MLFPKRIPLAIKLISFVLVTFLFVGIVNDIQKPKYYFTDTWPTTSTYLDFYKLDKNSVDVLFFGSSHGVCSFNPQIIYDRFGITGYNLSCEQQSPLVTYYWLREALKYQSPKAVVIDVYTFHMFYPGSGLNCNEEAFRKSMDYLRFSPLKLEAVRDAKKYDSSVNKLSFFLSNIRYHTRWKNLGEDDYTRASMTAHGGVKGFTVTGGKNPEWEDYSPFAKERAGASESNVWVEISKDYADRIVKLCNEENIKLIFTNIPSENSLERYKANAEYAELNNISYYDFNEASLYNEINYDAANDLLNHPNYIGAQKISLFLGEILSKEYGIEPREDESYNLSGKVYEHKVKNLKLKETVDPYLYREYIADEAYSVFYFEKRPDGMNYFSLKDSGEIAEELTEEVFEVTGAIRNGAVFYKAKPGGLNIDGDEYNMAEEGLNIVVYDNEEKQIIDSVIIKSEDQKDVIYR